MLDLEYLFYSVNLSRENIKIRFYLVLQNQQIIEDKSMIVREAS